MKQSEYIVIGLHRVRGVELGARRRPYVQGPQVAVMSGGAVSFRRPTCCRLSVTRRVLL
jgi:hypothetical protein